LWISAIFCFLQNKATFVKASRLRRAFVFNKPKQRSCGDISRCGRQHSRLRFCAAYLFGGLAKDRITARYRRESLTDPLTGIANRRGFFQRGERLLMRARFAREPTALILFDLDRFKPSMTNSGTGSAMKSSSRFVD
jgi:GGDEF domain-containing protein